MSTLAEVRRWNGAALGDVAADLARSIDRLVGLQDELDAARTVPGWTGGASLAAQTTAQGLEDRLETVVSGVSAVREATGTASEGVTALLRRIATADTTASAAGLVVSPTGVVTAPPGPGPGDAALAQQLTTEYQAVVQAAVVLDTTYTAALEAAARGHISADGAGGITALLQPPGLASAAAYGASHVPGAPPPGLPGGPQYVIGSPTRPPLEFDDDFPYDPDADAGVGDLYSWNKWGAMADGARVLKPGLDDASDLYDHYRGASGDPVTVDYEEAYREDPAVRRAVDAEIARARGGAEQIHDSTGLTRFSMSGDASPTGENYPTTENWQKALGAHQTWGSGDVRVDGTTATMTVAVHAADRYNFNRGADDIASGAPDDENGRFSTLGWAKGFDTDGTVTRTVTWELGSTAPPTVTEGGDITRDAPGEDRADGSRSGR